MVWESTGDFIRSGHGDKGSFDPKSFRTIDIDKDKGIKAVVGCRRGKYINGRCKVGMQVQSYLFSKDKDWTMEKAKAWFSKHKEEVFKAENPHLPILTYLDSHVTTKTMFTKTDAIEVGAKIVVDFTKIDINEFTMGLNIELEHGSRDPQTNVTGDCPLLTGKIALAHLKEVSNYYTKLKEVEK